MSNRTEEGRKPVLFGRRGHKQGGAVKQTVKGSREEKRVDKDRVVQSGRYQLIHKEKRAAKQTAPTAIRPATLRTLAHNPNGIMVVLLWPHTVW